MPSISHPYLPQDLVNELKSEVAHTSPGLTSESYIFDPRFEELRLKVVKLAGDRSFMDMEIVREDTPTEFLPLPAPLENMGRLMDNIQCFRPGDAKNLLHSAVHDGDVLAAYETLRIGINIDGQDAKGATPLFLALESIYTINVSQMGQAAKTAAFVASLPPHLRPSYSSDEELKLQIEHIERIAILLIEQHADVDTGAFGSTPLTLAVATARWRIVKLLLRHGALPASPYSMELASSTNKDRFATLIADNQPTNPRPPRPCPCWSGKLLSECHDAAKQPYPDHFLCCCGKQKTYGVCCSKRGLIIQEKWDRETARIVTIQASRHPSPDIPPQIQQDFNAGLDMAHSICQRADPMRIQEAMITTPEARCEFLRHHLNAPGRKDDVDPAFWHGLSLVNFLPRSWTTRVSVLEGQKRMYEWNAVVDSYILKSFDVRPTFEIELKAKIDSRGGPLHKRCEATGCLNVAGRDIEKMMCCSGCKLIVYCGRECQSRDWKRHKKDCGPKTHRSQLLPSQLTLMRLMATLKCTVAIGAFNKSDEFVSEDIERTSIQIISALGFFDLFTS